MVHSTRAFVIILGLLSTARIMPAGALVLQPILPKGLFSSPWRLSRSTSLFNMHVKDKVLSRQRMSPFLLSSSRRFIPRKAVYFLLEFTLLLSLWRAPAHAVKAPLAREGYEKRVIQPQIIPISKSIGVRGVSVVVVGVSGAAFTIRRRKHQEPDGMVSGEGLTSDPQPDPLEVETEKETRFLQEDDCASPSVEKLDQVIMTENDNGNDELDDFVSTIQKAHLESSPTSDDDVPNESSTQDKSIKFMEISNADETKIEAKTNGNDSDSTSVLETEETIKKESAVTKENNLLQEETIPATYPSRDPTSVTSRQQPKSKQEEEQLATKYAQIVNVSERAYQILVDLGMVDESEQIDVTKFNGTIDLEN